MLAFVFDLFRRDEGSLIRFDIPLVPLALPRALPPLELLLVSSSISESGMC